MKGNKKVLGFVGDLSVGKGTVAKYLKEKHQINSYRFSTILRDVVHRLYIEESRENLQKLSTVLRENFGQDVMSKVIAQDVLNDPNSVVAVEGIRRPSDIVYLEQNPNFHLIYITADPKIRWQRMTARGENTDDTQKTFEEFLRDEQSESDKLIKELGQKAKFKINNDGTFEELYNQVEELLKKVKDVA